ncbi:DUF6088 family protein [Bacillus sp. DJP31]|uniref:DUF6088 family protein n=1 Tax=Bacillus sp. DJP31 TaxID=3409789 RepID=UPI003BB48E5A
MNLYQYILDTYGYDEPVFLDELKSEVTSLKPESLRQAMKRLVDNGKIYRYRDGIYFIPNPSSVLKSTTLSVNKIINNKYLYRKDQRIGYITGLSFANLLKLTTQNPGMIEVVTSAEKATVRIVNFNKRKVTLRKPRVEINNENYKILQVLDLLTNFDKVSTKPISLAAKNIIEYLGDVDLTSEQLNNYLYKYPKKTFNTLLESEVFYELTQRRESLFGDSKGNGR